ncbi:M20 family metallopeptidase [Crossiella cryophila]|uniref:Glutamate carboxypeptidase n=1 Tax=Crossiella cryophila TaxID=43355 RepID=A0A7W7FU33_9PSEU|nr:glutamate carboxypeptidase [Crossiella cryophila]
MTSELLQRATSALPALLEDIGEVVSCESPSADLAAVARSADVVSELGRRLLGVTPARLVLDGVTHLRWVFGDRPEVLVLAHHDTVWPIGTLARIPFSVTDGVLRGPGCFDMKTGLVQALHALSWLPSLDGVAILVTGDEELGSFSSRRLIEETARDCAAVFVLEASANEGAIKTERKGAGKYQVAITGRAAHAGLEPELGVNSGIELAHQVLAIAALGDPELGTTVVPTVMSAGTTTNTVPAEAIVHVDVRARTIAEQQRVDAAIRALTPVLPGIKLEPDGTPNRPPMEARVSADLYARAVRLGAELGLPPLTSAAVGGASDGNFTAGIGVPTLDGLGAVGNGAHAEHEHVLTAHIPQRAALLAALVQDVRTPR